MNPCFTITHTMTQGLAQIERARGFLEAVQLSSYVSYKGVKESNWSATDVVEGVDGVARRWVYLHYFKQGQPSLNWLDPSFAAPRLVIGDALHSLDVLGARGLRLDANGFLGVEKRQGGPAWSEGHPLSLTANQLIAGMVRKLGGFTFQELNLTVDDIAAMSRDGADLAYDGAYDLLAANPAATGSAAGLPKAVALYGPLPEQLSRPDSFASQLKVMLQVRQSHKLYAARQIDVPDTASPGLLVMVHELPDDLGAQVTAINFGAEPVDEVVRLAHVPPGQAVNMYTDQIEAAVDGRGVLRIALAGHAAKSYLIQREHA